MEVKGSSNWIAVGLGPLVMMGAVARVSSVRTYQLALNKLKENGQECDAQMSNPDTSKDCFKFTHCFLDVSFIAESQRITVEKLEVSRNFYDQIKRELSSVEGNSVNAKVMYDPTCLLRFSMTQEITRMTGISPISLCMEEMFRNQVYTASLEVFAFMVVYSLFFNPDILQIVVMLGLMLFLPVCAAWYNQTEDIVLQSLLRKGQQTAATEADIIGVGTNQTAASVELAVTLSDPKGTAESNDGNMFDDMDQNTAMSMDDDISKVPSGMSEGKVLSTHEVNLNATDSGMEAPPAYDASLPPAYGTDEAPPAYGS